MTTLTDQLIAHAAEVSGIDEAALRASLPGEEGTWTFTFGPDHVHPATGEPLGGCYVQVPGGEDASRDRMVAVFGLGWSHQHPTPQRQVSHGMREIPFPGFETARAPSP